MADQDSTGQELLTLMEMNELGHDVCLGTKDTRYVSVYYKRSGLILTYRKSLEKEDHYYLRSATVRLHGLDGEVALAILESINDAHVALYGGVET